MGNVNTPLIKEHRIDRVEKCLECIDKHAFNRNKQRDCVLSLYPTKNRSLEHREKSIFRGMVLPSLRYLGLTISHGQSIRLSANGKLIIASHVFGDDFHNRVLRLVIYEIDENRFHFLDFIRNFSSHNRESLIEELSSGITGPSEKQKRERIRHWLSALKQVCLIDYVSESIFLNDKNMTQTLKDIDASLNEMASFRRQFLDSYFELGRNSAGIVDIAELREAVSIALLRNRRVILAEKQFDQMMRNIILEANEYIVSLGKPMGARDKLFERNGEYFRTVFIRRKREAR